MAKDNEDTQWDVLLKMVDTRLEIMKARLAEKENANGRPNLDTGK